MIGNDNPNFGDHPKDYDDSVLPVYRYLMTGCTMSVVNCGNENTAGISCIEFFMKVQLLANTAE